jgi:hypothetical protein
VDDWYKVSKKEENFKICHTKLSPEQSPERSRAKQPMWSLSFRHVKKKKVEAGNL